MKFTRRLRRRATLLGLGLMSLAIAPLTPALAKDSAPALQARVQANHVAAPLPYVYTPEAITQLATSTLTEAGKAIDAIAAIPDAQRTFANTVQAFEMAESREADTFNMLGLLAQAYSDPKAQAAAGDAGDKASAFDARTFARPELYHAMQVVASKSHLQGADARLMSETLDAFRRTGAGLPEERRRELTTLREQLTHLETEFGRNLAQANDTVELSDAELAGMTADYIKGLKVGPHGGHLVTLLDASQYIPFIENARSGEARRKVLEAKDKVAAATNVPLLEKAIATRHRIAVLMGYPNHAAYALDSRMARSPERVKKFLGDLTQRLVPKARAEMAELLKLKQHDDPKASRIEAWDVNYYLNALKKSRYAVDNEAVREYFPVDHVLTGVFETYQQLLGVHFAEIDVNTLGKPWASDLRLFEVHDAKDGRLLSYFYLDLYPRANKYKHFAAFPLRDGRRNADGSYTAPIAAIVGNFPAPVEGKAALMRHNEVETFFHEFGHIMHGTLTAAPYVSLAGANVRRDFVEAPSQMLENWAWNRAILARVSKHYKTGKPLPAALLDKMLAARHAGDGLMYTRQLMFASVDMAYHTSGEKVETTALWHDARRSITLIEPMADSQPQATFGHLMGGYDAGYYGYLWSKVYAEDMFTVFEREGVTSPLAGGRYRSWVLERGNTADPDVLLRGFLGREPNPEAFYKSIGL